MGREVVVNIQDLTGAVSQQGFGLPLVFDPNNDINYQEVTDTSQIVGLSAGDLTYEIANQALSQDPKPEKVAIYGVDVVNDIDLDTITDALNDLVNRKNDWYQLGLASRVDEDITETASWANSHGKYFVAQLDITKPASEIETFMATFESDITAIMAHDGGVSGNDPYLDGGVLGYLATETPGTYTLKFKTINGVEAATYSPTDIQTIVDAMANTYIRNRGTNYVVEGTSSTGSFIDTEIWKDKLGARLEEEIFRILKVNKKIPFDDSGISQIQGAMNTVLKNEDKLGAIAHDEDDGPIYSVSVPRRTDIPENDVANRKVTNVTFDAVYSNGIHEVEVNGAVRI
jgi:hypothetical protein